MQENRALIVHFNDATTLSFILPSQVDDESVADKFKKVLSAEQVVIEADGSLFIIPQSSIKYIQAYPAPSRPTDNVISGATLTDEP